MAPDRAPAEARSVAVAWASVRDRARDACRRAGRDPASVRVVAVSKTVPAERVRELLAAGHRLLGENRVQEALAKMEALGPGPEWHLVGHLQTNKVRHAVGRFALIHGVDRDELAAEIDRRAARAGVRQAVLLQVNLAAEATKYGVSEAEAPGLVVRTAGLEHVELRGLMTIPPPVDDPERSRPWFERLRRLRDLVAERAGVALPELSMGMTDDFEVAIEEGATLVRVGRAIFGERPPPA